MIDYNNCVSLFILEGKTVKPCPNIYKWSLWFKTSRSKRKIARTMVSDVLVSTVFLGIDHGWGKKLLFETMTFNKDGGAPPDGSDVQQRYSTYAQAIRGHKAIVKRLKDSIKP